MYENSDEKQRQKMKESKDDHDQKSTSGRKVKI